MLLVSQALKLFRKYGRAAKTVATGVLDVVAPGSGSLIELVGNVIDAVGEAADKEKHDNWEREVLERLQGNEAELARLGQLLDCLAGPLAAVCDKAAAFADQADDLPDIIARAIAADPTLSQVLHQVGGLKEQFDVFNADMKRLADRQEEAVPVYVRMNRVADYFDELWQAGIKPKDFAHCLRSQHEAVARIEKNDTADLDTMLLDLRAATPKAASVCVLEAAAATREFNYPAAQRALTSAMRLKPGDAGLLELSRRVTKMQSGTKPPSARPQPGHLKPGDVLDGWLLEARLGAGGWGQVFKAIREGQTRAVKVMHQEFAADRAFVSRFKKEIATLLKLPRHPNLLRIDDDGFGRCAQHNTEYLVMEYVDGPTLEQYLAAKGPLSESQVHKVFAHAIEGLAKAHAAGIVHRDIKPGNLIFRKSDQRLVFVDFGLAVGVEDFGQTKVGGISVNFAAPEQHYGESATQASDVFSLCAVIHYAMHFDKPEQRKPHRFSPNMTPESLRAALTQGMKNIEERLGDAGQFLKAFIPVAKAAEVEQKVEITADPVTEYAQWKKQVEELKTQADHAADVFDFARAVAILTKVPAKQRNDKLLADWTRNRDRLKELWDGVESGWRDMAEDELADQLEEIVSIHPDHPRAKPWLAQFGTAGERRQRKLGSGKLGDIIELPLDSSLKVKFAWVPPGTSWLGGGGGKPGPEKFTLAKGLWCGVYPATQAEWQAVMGDDPSHFKNKPRHPVESVSWDHVQEFLRALNAKLGNTGLSYRLPTEQEWEYICRGGPLSSPDQSKYHFYFATSKIDRTAAPTDDLSSRQANFDGNYPFGAASKGPYLQTTSEVGSYLPNPLGIYDLHGNVWEWTSSQEGSVRVIRGGSWLDHGERCQAASRGWGGPGDAYNFVGFRLLAVPVG